MVRSSNKNSKKIHRNTKFNSLKIRDKIHEVIFEADTPLGKLFDIVLIILILSSLVTVMLESVESINAQYKEVFKVIEWSITIFFSVEYILRVVSVKKPKAYIFSFYGIIDLLATLPLYISLFTTGYHALITVRTLRLLRIFRILKIVQYTSAASHLGQALRASRIKILVFIYTVCILAILLGTLMYIIEPESSGFSSIPRSIYWTVVTLTTVGYGDIAPQTPLGQFIATMVMILGYGIIAVPTGIVTASLNQKYTKQNTQACRSCSAEGHEDDAQFCFKCGDEL